MVYNAGMNKQPDKLKVLLFDIETSPNISYTWGKWEQDVIEFLEEGHLLCYSWKWLGDKKVQSKSLPDFKGYKQNLDDDYQLVKSLHKLFQEADIIVAHNGSSFDVKMSNRFFLKHGLDPISEYRIVDTKLLAKSKFRFNSNKLDDLGSYLGLGMKLETGGFDLWKECMKGDLNSWRLMVKYNQQDVTLLEQIYNKLVPWCKHPIVYTDKIGCRVCGSHDLQHRGWAYVDSGKSRKPRVRCNKCGRWSLGDVERV